MSDGTARKIFRSVEEAMGYFEARGMCREMTVHDCERSSRAGEQ